MSHNWTTEELLASVEAYFDMMHKKRSEKPFTKKHYYDALARKFSRTAKAFEYRMQNISYVLSVLGREWLPGLPPAKNVGANVAAQIEKLIGQYENRQMANIASFEIAVINQLNSRILEIPAGSLKPHTESTTITQFQRNPSVKAWVLKQANGICECCSCSAPFNTVEGHPFLEVHHVRMLADGGSDTISNAVALCPNCHREFHYGINAPALKDNLYRSVQRLQRE